MLSGTKALVILILRYDEIAILIQKYTHTVSPITEDISFSRLKIKTEVPFSREKDKEAKYEPVPKTAGDN